jgi:CheY-like chemotaxis protein
MDALDACQQDLVRKQIQIRTAFGAEHCHVNADRTKLHQIVWNLVKNAAKFSHVGGVVSLITQNNESGEFVLQVIDHGIGIEPQTLQRIFIPFEQGGSAMHRRFGGLGLGLSVSKAIAEAHGGSLEAASDGANCGATLTLKLGVDDSVPEVPLAAQGAGAAAMSCADVRVLLVEDHEDTRFALERFLRRRGYEVTTASNAESALQSAEVSMFDVVVSDIGLPDGSGLELIRTLQARRPTKGIAISGFGMEGDLEKSRAAGFSDHLLKPINPESLDAAIRNVIGVP